MSFAHKILPNILQKTKIMENPKFQVFKGKDNQYYFRLRAKNGEIVCNSEGYTTIQSCKQGIEAIKRIAQEAPIEDMEK